MTRRNAQRLLLSYLGLNELVGSDVSILQNSGRAPITGPDGRIEYRFPAFAGYVSIDIGGGQQVRLACIPGGSGLIGSEFRSRFRPYETTPVRLVTIRPFLLGCFEITLAQWLQASRLPRVGRDLLVWFETPATEEEARWPVEAPVTYFQAIEFCSRISNYSGVQFRLPSEAEWEYSCRASTRTSYHFGNSLGNDILNSEVISFRRFQPVGNKNAPNRFGLHDMHGGLSEWCEDWSNRTYNGAPLDGSPWVGSGDRNIRMVRSIDGGEDGGSATRSAHSAAGYYTTLGLRVAATWNHGIMDVLTQGCAHGASQVSGLVSAGQILSIYGSNLGPASRSSGTVFNGLVSTEAGGVEVYFDDVKAPVLFVSKEQVNVVVPFGVAGKDKVRIVVRNGFQSAHPFEVKMERAQPGLFTGNGTGQGIVAAFNTDGGLHGIGNPAPRGSVIVLYGTGFGPYTTDFSDGEVAKGARPMRERIGVFIDGKEGVIEYAGAAPGLVAGVVQLNVRIPNEVRGGEVEILLEVLGVQSARGVKMVVSG